MYDAANVLENLNAPLWFVKFLGREFSWNTLCVAFCFGNWEENTDIGGLYLQTQANSMLENVRPDDTKAASQPQVKGSQSIRSEK